MRAPASLFVTPRPRVHWSLMHGIAAPYCTPLPRSNTSLTMLDLADTHCGIQGLIGIANALTDGNQTLKVCLWRGSGTSTVAGQWSYGWDEANKAHVGGCTPDIMTVR
jgi:hypothetical protein